MKNEPQRSLTGGDPGRSDADLAAAAQGGNKPAFVEIVARHQAMVAGVALAILRDFAASEDAAQEAFLTAWKKIGELREPAKLRAWLASIARTTALMHLRKRRPAESIESARELAGPGFGPDETIASREECALVLTALEELPENYRLPLVLFYREDQSVRAVAEALELSEDAVKQRLSRGREMLRDRVAGVIDSVLGRTIPTAIFTMTIAAAIGALVAPSALAATVFSGAAAATGTAAAATGTTSTAATAVSTSATPAAAHAATTVAATTATTMSTSKLSLAAAAIVAVCLPVGYTARLSTESAREQALPKGAPAASQATAGDDADGPPALPDSPLVAEWKRMLDEYGSEAEDLPRLYQVLEGLDDPFRRRAFLASLIAEWARVDPAGGLAFFRAKTGWRDRWQRELLLEEWIKREPEAAIAGMRASGEGWEEIARDQLLRLARHSPRSVPALVEQLPKSTNHWSSRVHDAFEILATGDLRGTRAAAEALSGPNRAQALAGVARAWGEKDGAAALQWAQGLEEGLRFEAMRSALTGWARTDARAALDRIGLVPVGGDNMNSSSGTGARVLREAAKNDFEGTVAWLKDNPGKIGYQELQGLSAAVQPRLLADPAGFLSQHVAQGTLAPLMAAMGSALLNDAAGARLEIWEWLKSAPETDATKRLRQDVLSGLGWQDPRTAMRLVDELPGGKERDQERDQTANRVMNGGQNIGVLDNLLGDASPEWRAALLRAGLMNLRPEQFHSPELWVGRLKEVEGPARAGAVQSLARAWASDDPESSANWAATLEDPAERHTGMKAISQEWAKTDPYRAGDWVSGLAEGEERDAGVGGLAQGLALTEPQRAWEWVESVSEDEARFLTAREVVRAMMGRDREGAFESLDGSGLSIEEKSRVREVLENYKSPGS